MKRYLLVFGILVALSLFLSTHGFAQCAMCAGTVESTRGAGASTAEGVNKGVLYIFMMPYLIVGTIFYFWWRARKKVQPEQSEPESL